MFRPNKRITTVIFDLDDTLIDWSPKLERGADVSRRHIGNVYNFLLEDGHVMPPWETFLLLFREVVVERWTEAKRNWTGVNFEHVLTDTFVVCKLDLNRIDLNAILRAYNWQPVPGVVPYADTLPVLNTLKQSGYKIGLITNSMQPMWMRDIELDAYGILKYLDARITSGDAGYMKPHPYIYWMLLKRLHSTPKRTVFVGDRPVNDILGANKAGLTSVLMDPPHLNYSLDSIKPNFSITKLSELLPILKELD